MIIKVKFEYATSLRNECLTIVSSSYHEDGIDYVADEVVCLETQEKFRAPMYCPVKSFAGVVQSQYPTARVEVVQEKGVS